MNAISRHSDPGLDQPSPLLPQDPPPRAARWAAAWLLLVALGAGVVSVTFRFPETVVARVQVVAEGGTDPLQAPVGGELEKVQVVEGARVEAGAVLYRIRSEEIRNGQTRRQQLLGDRKALEERARRLEEAHADELGIKDAEITQAERELTFRDRHLETSRDLLSRAERLKAEGLISEVELLRHRLDAAESEKDRVLVEKLIQQLRLQRRERMTARERQRGEERAEGEKIGLQLAALDVQLEDAVGDVRELRAVEAVVVTRVVQGKPGTVVRPGDVLCEVARVGDRPVARLTLPQAAVPRTRPGQEVRLFLDAYPYQRHGTVPAVLRWVSPTSVPGEDAVGFVGLADLVEGQGPGLEVRIGMEGEARVLVGRRTLLERALEPIRGMKVRVLAR